MRELIYHSEGYLEDIFLMLPAYLVVNFYYAWMFTAHLIRLTRELHTGSVMN